MGVFDYMSVYVSHLSMLSVGWVGAGVVEEAGFAPLLASPPLPTPWPSSLLPCWPELDPRDVLPVLGTAAAGSPSGAPEPGAGWVLLEAG